jgi:hypothetical protein
MTPKRRLFAVVPRADLRLFIRAFELQMSPGMDQGERRGHLWQRKRALALFGNDGTAAVDLAVK